MLSLKLNHAQFLAVWDILSGAVEDLDSLADDEGEFGDLARKRIKDLTPIIEILDTHAAGNHPIR